MAGLRDRGRDARIIPKAFLGNSHRLSGEPGGVEPLSAEIRTPLASAYADLFLRADLAIQLLDALWLQGELTDAGHAERTGAMRRAPLSVLGAIQRLHARCRARIDALYRQRESSSLA